MTGLPIQVGSTAIGVGVVSLADRSIPIGFQHSGRRVPLRLDGPLLHLIVGGVWGRRVVAFEAGCEEYCEREIDQVEWQGGRVYLYLGAQRDEPPRR